MKSFKDVRSQILEEIEEMVYYNVMPRDYPLYPSADTLTSQRATNRDIKHYCDSPRTKQSKRKH